MHNRVLHSICATALLTASLAATGHDQGKTQTFWFGHPGKPGADIQTIKVIASDSRFDPTRIAIKRGATVRFVVTNQGRAEHEFILGDAHKQAEHDREMAARQGMKMHHVTGVSVAPGQTQVFFWKFTNTGVLQFACHVPGHYAAGMFGEVRVQ